MALPDLLERRAAALEGLLCGQLLLPQLGEVGQQIAALPFASDSPPQFVEQLSAADARHDGYTSALALFVQAYERLPDLGSEDTARLEAVAPIIPEAADVRQSYATQASRAQQRGDAASEAQRQALAAFPIAGGRTLADVFDAYVAAGGDIDSLLQQRADASTTESKGRGAAATLRVQAIGLLGQLRDALQGELRADPERAARLDKQVFAYVDLLQDSRAKNGPAAPPPDPPPAQS